MAAADRPAVVGSVPRPRLAKETGGRNGRASRILANLDQPVTFPAAPGVGHSRPAHPGPSEPPPVATLRPQNLLRRSSRQRGLRIHRRRASVPGPAGEQRGQPHRHLGYRRGCPGHHSDNGVCHCHDLRAGGAQRGLVPEQPVQVFLPERFVAGPVRGRVLRMPPRWGEVHQRPHRCRERVSVSIA